MGFNQSISATACHSMKLPISAILPVLALAMVSPLSAGEPDKAPVWKISDSDSTVYLAWSVHLLRKKDLPIPAVFDRVYAESEEVVFEVDMAVMSRPGAAAEMTKLGSLPAGETLSDRFVPETMKRLRAYLRDCGMREDFLDPYDPGMVFLLLSSLEAGKLGAKPEFGVETALFDQCLADGKPSRGLETMAYQVSLFDELDDSVIEEYLNRSLDQIKESPEAFDRLVEAWREGDAKALAAEVDKDTSMPDELRDLLLTKRNRNWIPEIEKALATDRDVMFLVGAAHLVGEESVVDLLRKRGIEVTQLANSE